MGSTERISLAYVVKRAPGSGAQVRKRCRQEHRRQRVEVVKNKGNKFALVFKKGTVFAESYVVYITRLGLIENL